jgi:hypothetical protein
MQIYRKGAFQTEGGIRSKALRQKAGLVCFRKTMSPASCSRQNGEERVMKDKARKVLRRGGSCTP